MTIIHNDKYYEVLALEDIELMKQIVGDSSRSRVLVSEEDDMVSKFYEIVSIDLQVPVHMLKGEKR